MRHRYSDDRLREADLTNRIAPFLYKLAWFRKNGYSPHYYQLLFHSMQGPRGTVARLRHLVAGRRGGKTLSAAWEVLFYVLHPGLFHLDAHGRESGNPLHVWVLTKDHVVGRAALLTFRTVLREAGLVHGKDYTENRGHRYFEFSNGSLVEFKTADDPESLRGAGLDILWIDEAAFLLTPEAWYVVRPALSDKEGRVITTTTPSGKNWFYDEFWSDAALSDPNQSQVEYRSIDNPYFPREEWEYLLKTYHPMLFKQEYMASFDSMAGKELAGDWLKFYTDADLPRDKEDPSKFDLDMYIGIDPAVSLSDNADRFAMAAIGITKDRRRAFLIDMYAGRIPFPDQIDLVQSWNIDYRPQIIGVEANAFQLAFAQQLERVEGFIPVVPILAKAEKNGKIKRILAMSTIFKIGKIKIRKEHRDFINEWVDYDSTLPNPKDDCLDAVEIALRTAGALLPEQLSANKYFDMPAGDMNELAARSIPGGKWAEENQGVDETLGSEW